ncbi:MAG: DUF4338 domain-containing protein [Bacteroidales bacterium]|nr:DUF4338 domain-containing protein [Candidatus Latescibacterota bacterium]
MNQITATINGNKVTPNLSDIQRVMDENPNWGRTRLSQELCKLWNWQGLNGQLKDMACRTMLLKLERNDCLTLPARQRKSTNGYRNLTLPTVSYSTEAIKTSLQSLRPLQITAIQRTSNDLDLFRCLLSTHHYLGLRNTVGENMKYIIRDQKGRPLSCMLFGSAAWKTKSRDQYIGWDASTREKNLMYLTNNTRFLILPWIQVPHLASHILSQIAHRLSSDWMEKYSHPIYLLETFVERDRFRGICYQAANWICTGQTKGRTRNDRYASIQAPIKDVYVYPLSKRFRRELCHGV